MNFQRELAEKVMAGEKTVTRRLVSENSRSPWWREKCVLAVGRDYAVCPGRGKDQIGRVVVISVRQETLGDAFGAFGRGALQLTSEAGRLAKLEAQLEAQREGFANAVAFQLAWLKINGTYDTAARVWRVEFERV